MSDDVQSGDGHADNAADGVDTTDDAVAAFGDCCDELQEALSGDGFDTLFNVGEDGILYMSVGEVDMGDEHRNFVDHPVFYCPFCGTGLQSRDEVMKKLEAEVDEAGGDDEDDN